MQHAHGQRNIWEFMFWVNNTSGWGTVSHHSRGQCQPDSALDWWSEGLITIQYPSQMEANEQRV